MAARGRRQKPPLQDAIEHVVKALDKTTKLDVQYINSFKGRGVFAKDNLTKGDFVVEYRGELINYEESEKRRRIYHAACSVFMFDISWKEKIWCIDAAREDGSLGRLVNDDHRHPNCKMKKVMIENRPYLCLFALRDISPGEEITYDYGSGDWPWRKQPEEQSSAAKFSNSGVSGTVEKTTEEPPSSIMQPEEQSSAAKFSNTEVSGTVAKTTEEPPSSIMQPEEQSSAAKFSNTEVSETVAKTTEEPPSSIMQPEEQSSAAKFSNTEVSGTVAKTTEEPPSSIMQPEEQSSAAKFSNTEVSETVAKTTEEPPSSIMQPEEQSCATKSSHNKVSRRKKTNQRPSSSVMQPEEQCSATKSSHNKVSRRKKKTTQGPSSSNMQPEEQSSAAKFSNSGVSGTVEKTTEEPPSSIMQLEEQPSAAKFSNIEVSGTVEKTTEEPTSSIMQDLVETKPVPSKHTDGQHSPLYKHVDYTESDESQRPCTSTSQLEGSWQERQFEPRLRRTKSIQMKGRTDFDSDELFDTTSDDSGEEYIPKSCEDSSDDTDTSNITDSFNKKMNKNRFPNLGKMMMKRGRSPFRKDHTSLRKHNRRCSSSVSCPRTQTTTVISTKQSGERVTGSGLESSVSEEKQNYPDSSTGGVADGLLTIPGICKKENGSRMYNKKQYCVYCKLGMIKMARHLERAHKDEPEVARAISFPKGSKERRLHMEHLRNKGNFAHNVQVLNSGVGTPVPRKQPKDVSQVQNFMHCAYCQGFFTKKILWRHMKICKLKPKTPVKPGRTRVQALCAFAVPPPPGVKEQVWKLINGMIQDEVYFAVKSDACVIEYAEHLYNRLGYDDAKHEYIRQKLRELGRLLLCSRKITPLKTIQDHIKPANFMHVVKAVKDLAGYNSETYAYSCPSLALKIGYTLKKLSMLVESRANVQSDFNAAKDARTFRRVYETRWNEMISAASLRNLQESKWNTPQLLPFTKDVQTLHSYLDAQQQDLFSKLSSDASIQTWTQLTKIILTQVILFNRRRAGEVSKLPLSIYLSDNPSDPDEDVNASLSDLEKRLCHHFRRIEIRGKRGRKVPVLLTPAMQQSLDLLVCKRQECGVLPENTYLFARPATLIYYRGSDCLRRFAKISGVKNPESLTSTKLRKQTGTLSQVLNLTNTELDQLANFLGHDIRVHRQFYRLPEGTLQLAKISKVLLALEQGRLAEFKGKSLDDINIDPEENVHQDSEQDVEPEEPCELDTGHQSSSTEDPATTEDNETSVSLSYAAPQDTMTPPQATGHNKLKSLKGRQPGKRQTWERDEIAAVERHLMSFITSCRVPGKSDCDKCLNAEKSALRNRSWLAVKFYVKNRITALKKQV